MPRENRPPTLDVVFECQRCFVHTMIFVNHPDDEQGVECRRPNCPGGVMRRIGIAYIDDDGKSYIQKITPHEEQHEQKEATA
jgi:hypothetical protein